MTRWYHEKKQEHFYKKAKAEGYRARSAYKLLQIHRRFHIFSPEDIVIDLGAAPGGWSQVARKLIGPKGIIIGIDLEPIKPLKGVVFLSGDITSDETQAELHDQMDHRSADVVLSDLSPNISGNYSVDHARSIYLSQQASTVASQFLKQGGTFVCKLFEGEMINEFISVLQTQYSSIKRFNPPASRKSSSEIYIIGKQFRK
jgi:23S rRNA (uridine2552-2'-O)-methyltransferase